MPISISLAFLARLHNVIFVGGGGTLLLLHKRVCLPSQHDNLPVPIPFIHLGGEEQCGLRVLLRDSTQWAQVVASTHKPCYHESNALTSAPRCHTLAVIAENVPISSIPILIFLCIIITASSPVSHSYFPPGEKIRNNLEVKLYKMCLRGQCWSVKSDTSLYNFS